MERRVLEIDESAGRLLPRGGSWTAALMERQPDCAEAHFNLATMSLEDESQLTLEHFEAGEGLEPEDPDYLVGAARALVKLGRDRR